MFSFSSLCNARAMKPSVVITLEPIGFRARAMRINNNIVAGIIYTSRYALSYFKCTSIMYERMYVLR
jgi:hypothetical protein